MQVKHSGVQSAQKAMTFLLRGVRYRYRVYADNLEISSTKKYLLLSNYIVFLSLIALETPETTKMKKAYSREMPSTL